MLALDDTEQNERTISNYADKHNIAITWLAFPRANNYQFIWYCWLWTGKKKMKHDKKPHKILTCPRANNYQFIWYCWHWTGKKLRKTTKIKANNEDRKVNKQYCKILAKIISKKNYSIYCSFPWKYSITACRPTRHSTVGWSLFYTPGFTPHGLFEKGLMIFAKLTKFTPLSHFFYFFL